MASIIFHPIEKQIIKSLNIKTSTEFYLLLQKTKLNEDQLRRGIEWLKLKNLIDVINTQEIFVSLDTNALFAYRHSTPERKILKLVSDKPRDLQELKKLLKSDFDVAIAKAKKNSWIDIMSESQNTIVHLGKVIPPSITPEEKLILSIGNKKIPEKEIVDKKSLESLKKRRDFIKYNTAKSKSIILKKKIKLDELIETKQNNNRVIDVESEVPLFNVARVHPLRETINDIRDILISFGFSEIQGPLIQSSFWNFDALFTPQNHPVREMQDTFYLEDQSNVGIATSQQIKNVSAIHEQKWHYKWKLSEAQKMTLRTHTTCITIRHIANHKLENAQIFSLGRVFRNEKSSYKHLSEFHQIEGLIIGKDINLRHLMGIQKEFCRRIGITKIKFWPTFFPYTEPSLQTMVYNENTGKWLELFGMGIIRPEVTNPLGIKKPILAFGGGIERIAMLKYMINDVREFYTNDLTMLRNFKCR